MSEPKIPKVVATVVPPAPRRVITLSAATVREIEQHRPLAGPQSPPKPTS